MPLYTNLTDLQCPACSKFFTTTQGRDSHLLQAKSCQWYHRGKLREIPFRDDLYPYIAASNMEIDTQPLDEGPVNWQDDLHYAWEDPNWLDPSDDKEGGNVDLAANEEVDHNEFILLPQPGSGPQTQENRSQSTRTTKQRVLDDEDDTRVIVEHPTAGAVLSRVQDKNGDISMEEAGSQCVEDRYAPFSMELDWKFAGWAVKESIGHNALDRLLAIPGV